MNSLLKHALSHPIYSLVAALLTGFVSAWSTSTLFYDAHHSLSWFDIGLFLPVVLIAASAKASNDLTNRNRKIAFYLVGYLSLLWYQAPETGVQILVKGAVVAIVVYAVVRSSTPVFDDWKTENPDLRIVGILAVIIGSLINSYLDGKSGYAGFAELFFPSFLAILSARILMTRFNTAQDNNEPFKLYFLIPVALLIGQILFVNFASEAFLRPAMLISLALLSAAISLPYRLFCLFLPTAILINAIEFSITPYTQDIVTDRVLLTLAVVALTSSLIASMMQKLKKSEASLLKSATHLSQAVNRFEKISSVTDISLFEQIDEQGSLWCNSQLSHILETPNQTLLTVNDLLEKLTLNDSPVYLETITPQEGVPFKAIVTITNNGNSDKKALLTINRDNQGFIYGSLVDQTEVINRGNIAIKAMKQAELSKDKNETLISILKKASEITCFDLASIYMQKETINFAFSGRSIKFPGDTISLEELTSRVKRSHREALSYLLQGRIDNCELALDLSRTETIWWKVVRVRSDDQKIELFIQDISLAKRTQDRFIQSRGEAELAIRKLNIATDTSGIGLFELDPINEKLRPSATLREMLNLPQSEKISIRGFLGLFDENSNQDFLYTFQNLTKLQGSKHFN
jgi:PAS domain-containing protein/multisubunit Na+/H+ antiporter MnhB subunit